MYNASIICSSVVPYPCSFLFILSIECELYHCACFFIFTCQWNHLMPFYYLLDTEPINECERGFKNPNYLKSGGGGYLG